MAKNLITLQQAEKAAFTKRFGAELPDPFEYKPSLKNTAMFSLFIYGPLAIVVAASFWARNRFGMQSDELQWVAYGGVLFYGIVAMALMRIFNRKVTTESAPAKTVVLDYINSHEPNTRLSLQQNDDTFALGYVALGYTIQGRYHGSSVEYYQHSNVTGRSTGGTSSSNTARVTMQANIPNVNQQRITVRKGWFGKITIHAPQALPVAVAELLRAQKRSLDVTITSHNIVIEYTDSVAGCYTMQGMLLRIDFAKKLVTELQ